MDVIIENNRATLYIMEELYVLTIADVDGYSFIISAMI